MCVIVEEVCKHFSFGQVFLDPFRSNPDAVHSRVTYLSNRGQKLLKWLAEVTNLIRVEFYVLSSKNACPNIELHTFWTIPSFFLEKVS